MNEQDEKRVLEISKILCSDIRAMLDKYSVEVSNLSNHDDPHTPVIRWLQLNLMQASVEYLVANGIKPSEALKLATISASESAKAWFQSVSQTRGSKYALNK